MSNLGNLRPELGHWKKGQSGNPNGRPKKLYKTVIDEVKKEGYTPPTEAEYREMMKLLMVMTEEELIKRGKDKDTPYWIRLIIDSLGNKKTRDKVMSDYRDWIFGRASQDLDLTTKGESLNKTVNLEKLDLETLKKLKESIDEPTTDN